MLPTTETIKVFSGIFLVAFAYLFVQHDDYHKKFDKPLVIQYNCDKLYDNTPKDVIDMCNESDRRFIIVKTY